MYSTDITVMNSFYNHVTTNMIPDKRPVLWSWTLLHIIRDPTNSHFQELQTLSNSSVKLWKLRIPALWIHSWNFILGEKCSCTCCSQWHLPYFTYATSSVSCFFPGYVSYCTCLESATLSYQTYDQSYKV